MNLNKKGSASSQHTCEVCDISFALEADYALHEFSKKHCDNLVRLARNKPIVNKQKAKNETKQEEKELPKVKNVLQTGSFAKYGYFVPGEIYKSPEVSKEFNTEYDPYLQKFAENPFKEKVTPSTSVTSVCQTTQSNPTGNISFNRKKKKKIKSCQICSVTLTTVPEYEAHMRSPQHIWKLKISGIGVSAHFIKASSDLHTTDFNEDSKPAQEEKNNVTDANSLNSFPSLYCDVCELLLNSPQQYNAHVSGKQHIECAQKKAEIKSKKEKLQNPAPNQLYCYSCKISLNNLFQYNEHKNGKKHNMKCKQLIREGITIPPEERVPGLVMPKYNQHKPVIYPELYEKFVLDKNKGKDEKLNDYFEPVAKNNNLVQNDSSSQKLNEFVSVTNISSGVYHCSICNIMFKTVSDFEDHMRKNHNHILGKSSSDKSSVLSSLEGTNNSGVSNYYCGIITTEEFKKPITDLHSVAHVIAPGKKCLTSNNASLVADTKTNGMIIDSESSTVQIRQESFISSTEKKNEMKRENFSNTIVGQNEVLKCNICNENFQEQLGFDSHLNSEDHMKKILELKVNGKSESEILKIIFCDRNVIKPDKLGRHTCSICSVTTNNGAEYEQHLNSILHKYTLKDYKIKRTTEVKQIVGRKKEGKYFCSLCNEGWSSLLEFSQHLHFLKHRRTLRTIKAKEILAKRTLFLQRQRLRQSLKKSKFSAGRLESEKNPGVRTKICGVATDLCTGVQAPIPNLEPLEPKIDPTKNVQLGVAEKSNCKNLENDDRLKEFKVRKRKSKVNSSRKPLNSMLATKKSNLNKLSCKSIPPLITAPCSSIPPLMRLPPLQSSSQCFRPLQPPNLMPRRNWDPYFSSYQCANRPFYSRPPSSAYPYPRPPWTQRTRWPRY